MAAPDNPLTPGPGQPTPPPPQAPDPGAISQAMQQALQSQGPPNVGTASAAPPSLAQQPVQGRVAGGGLPAVAQFIADMIRPGQQYQTSGPGTMAELRPASRTREFEGFLGQFVAALGQGFAGEGRGPGAALRGAGAAITGPMQLGMQQQAFQQQQQLGQAELAQRQAQTQQTQLQTQQMGQMVDVPGVGPVPFSLAKVIAPQAVAGQAKVQAAQIAARFKAGPQGLYDTQTRQLIPATANGIQITPEIAQDYGLTQDWVGRNMKLSDLKGLESNQIAMAPTTTTTTDPLGLTTTSTKSKRLPQSLLPGGAPSPAGGGSGPAAGGGGGSAIDSMAQRMVDGDMDPSQVPRRGASYAILAQKADQYSMQKYGQHFDMATAANDYQYARNATTQNTLKMINGITEKGGALDIAQNAAKALPAFDSQTVNKIFNAASAQFGSTSATNFHTAMLGLADEYSKVMGGGVSSDTGRDQALSLLKSSYSNGQLAGAVDIMRQDISARKQALIGNNRYLQRQYGQPQGGNSGQRRVINFTQ